MMRLEQQALDLEHHYEAEKIKAQAELDLEYPSDPLPTDPIPFASFVSAKSAAREVSDTNPHSVEEKIPFLHQFGLVVGAMMVSYGVVWGLSTALQESSMNEQIALLQAKQHNVEYTVQYSMPSGQARELQNEALETRRQEAEKAFPGMQCECFADPHIHCNCK
jgi:hypothetical protein